MRDQRPDLFVRLPLWAVLLLGAIAVPVYVIGGFWCAWMIALALGLIQ